MTGREIRTYDYVNQPYERVRSALADSASDILREATTSAADRARSVAAELRVSLGGLNVSTPISFQVGAIRDEPRGPAGPAIYLPISWSAVHHPELFPQMNAELAAYPLTATETQLDFRGHYVPPLGVVGSAFDAAAGRRIAEASIHTFVSDVTQYLRSKLK